MAAAVPCERTCLSKTLCNVEIAWDTQAGLCQGAWQAMSSCGHRHKCPRGVQVGRTLRLYRPWGIVSGDVVARHLKQLSVHQLVGRGLKVVLGHGPDLQHDPQESVAPVLVLEAGSQDGLHQAVEARTQSIHLRVIGSGAMKLDPEALACLTPECGGERRATSDEMSDGTPKRTTQTQMKAPSYIRCYIHCYIRHLQGEKVGEPAGGEKQAHEIHIDMIETTLKHLKNLPTAP